MHYFRVRVDPLPGAWVLGLPWQSPDGSWKDVWAYTRCEPVEESRPVELVVRHAGEPVDISFATFNIPVVRRSVCELIQAVAKDEVQAIPAVVRDADGEWVILNPLKEIDCLDRNRSEITYYPKDHPRLPGKPRGVLRLVVDPERAEGAHVLRLKDWSVPVIISEVVKGRLESSGVTGLQCEGVA